jgi:hypothetical protein
MVCRFEYSLTWFILLTFPEPVRLILAQFGCRCQFPLHSIPLLKLADNELWLKSLGRLGC